MMESVPRAGAAGMQCAELEQDTMLEGRTRLRRRCSNREAGLLLCNVVLVLVLTAVLAGVLYEGNRTNTDFHHLYSQHLSTAEYVDLTHAFGPDSPVWPGFGGMELSAGQAGKDIDGFVKKGDEFTYAEHGFVTSAFKLVTDQLGTQLDPPAHWNEFGATISDIPATFSVRPLCVVQIQDRVKQDAQYAATPEDIREYERKHGRIPEGAVVFFRSDWAKKIGWADNGAPGDNGTFPGVSLAALKMLHIDRKILMHGHEPLDTDSTPNLEGEAWLMHNNFAQAEGVANLHLVPPTGCLVSIGFAKPLGGTGGFARYVAVCPPGSSGGVTIRHTPGAPLPRSLGPLRRSASGVVTRSIDTPPTQYCKSQNALGCAGGALVR